MQDLCRSPRGSVDWNLTKITRSCSRLVAPLVGAWIEIDVSEDAEAVLCRSPRGSVDWNIPDKGIGIKRHTSLPSWERGLKSVKDNKHHVFCKSLPSWERGLKFKQCSNFSNLSWSLPSWERGLKFHFVVIISIQYLSLPSWERGLKFFDIFLMHEVCRRSPRGSVDWNIWFKQCT